MREIKFRAWDNHNKKWLHAKLFNVSLMNGQLQANMSAGSIGGCVVEQFTGLKDKNGSEIYEGDVLKFVYSHTNDVFYGYVLFHNGMFTDSGEISEAIEPEPLGTYNCKNREIVGNIHQNPELLK